MLLKCVPHDLMDIKSSTKPTMNHFTNAYKRNQASVNWARNRFNSPPAQNGCHFPDDTFRRIFVNEMLRILIKISLKFVPKGSIDINPVLVQVMAWHRIGDIPLCEPMLTLITDAYMRH